MTYEETLFKSLREAVDQRDEAETKIRRTVYACRVAGVSWEAIGAALGISKQAAWERHRNDEAVPTVHYKGAHD